MAILAGAAAKIYDDGVDSGILTDEYHKKNLETLECFLLGALSVNNFTFTFVAFTINFLHHLTNEESYKLPFERSLIIVYPIFLCISFASREYLTTKDILLLIYISTFFFFEPFFFEEDRSVKKFIFRLCGCIIFLYILYSITGLTNGMYLIFAYGLGYFIVSTLYQGYYLVNKSLDECIDEFIEGYYEIYTRFLTPDGKMYIFNAIPG